MKYLILFALSAFIFLSVSCTDDTVLNPSEQKDIAGYIQTPSGEMLVSAIISARKGEMIIATDTSDEFGYFLLKSVPMDYANVFLSVDHLANYTLQLSNYQAKIEQGGTVPFVVQENDSCCGSVIINLKHKISNAPIANAQVRLNKAHQAFKSKKTDSLGIASFTNLCPDEYNIRIAKDGFKVIEETVVITDCTPMNIDFLLEPKEEIIKDTCCNGIITFTFKDSTSNNAISGVRIKLWKDGKIIKDGKSSENGMFTMSGICEGPARFTYYYQDKEYVLETVFGCNDTLNITKFLNTIEDCCTAKFNLQIKDSADKTGINGARVKLWKGGALIGDKTTSDSRVVFSELCSGQYGVSISKDGYKSMEFNFSIQCPDTIFETKMLSKIANADSCCNGSIKVWVRDSITQKAIANKTVKLMQGATIIKDGKTDEAGKYIFTKICKGEYKANIIMSETLTITKSFNLLCNEEKVLEVFSNVPTNCDNAILKIRVKNLAKSQYLDSATVKIYKENGTLLETLASNVEGWAIFDGLLAPATYHVTVTLAGYKSREFNFVFNECKTIQETSIMEEL